jgi:glycoside/pentoside/hexuronide:cation symporter, GPH family
MNRLALLSYGAFGLPLAMVALPIYVYLPQFYAARAGLPLALVGTVLLGARVGAAFIDPLLGWWIARSGASYARFVAGASPLLLAGFVALFHPPAMGMAASAAWFLAALLVVYLGLGVAAIAHQSWGAALTQAPGERTRVSGVREACGLAGVVLAAFVSGAFDYTGLSLAFAAALFAALAWLLLAAPRPERGETDLPAWRAVALPLRGAPFRALFAVLLVNGVASAIPATLFLFFTADRLQLGAMAGAFLVLYFGAAAASIALWVRAARRHGEARAWCAGMLLSALVFVWAFALAPGAALPFALICALSGLALGADLALPPALLAGVIGCAGHAGRYEGAYFGLWNWGVQMSLALAAGIALPLLGALGYTPGQPGGASALAAVYALLPCVLKLAAAAMLWRAPLKEECHETA